MDSKRIIQFIVIILMFFPIFAFASSQDYLFVSFDYDHTTHVFSNISADQRVVDPLSVTGQDMGDYTITLQDSQGILSQAKFFIPDPTTAGMESLGTDTGDYGIPKKYSTTIELPLIRSIQASDGSISISHNGQILLTQKLSDTLLTVLKSNGNNIVTPTPIASFPPYPPMSQNNSFIHTVLLWSPLIILPIVLFISWFLFKKRKTGQPAIPPTPPATPPGPSTT